MDYKLILETYRTQWLTATKEKRKIIEMQAKLVQIAQEMEEQKNTVENMSDSEIQKTLL
jgi:hypothetical protein